MVLVDTSVWIRALANRQPWVDELGRLLSLDQVSGHDLIYGELLMGDCGGREKFLTTYQAIDQALRIPHREVVAFVRGRRLQGRGIGWIDAHLLASAVVGRHQLWTVDSSLSDVAGELGVAWQPQN